MISAYLIVAIAFIIVGTFLSVVRRFLNESERESPPPRHPTEPTEPTGPPPNRVSIVW
jgi:hypothetical protein